MGIIKEYTYRGNSLYIYRFCSGHLKRTEPTISHKERTTGIFVKLEPKRGKARSARPVGSAPCSLPGIQPASPPGKNSHLLSRTASGLRLAALLLRLGLQRARPPSRTPSEGPGSPLPTPAFLGRVPGGRAKPGPRRWGFGRPGGAGGARPRLPEPYLAQARRGARTGPAHLACPQSNSGGRAGGLGGFNVFAAVFSTRFPVSSLQAQPSYRRRDTPARRTGPAPPAGA